MYLLYQTFDGCFPNDLNSNGWPQTLAGAVDAYIDQDCANDETCAIGQTYGHPMNSWCVDKVTSFDSLFAGYTTFNEDINGWTTSQVRV